MVRVQDLAAEYRPRSADPDFGSAWRGKDHGHADWGSVAADWTAVPEADVPSGSDPDSADESSFDPSGSTSGDLSPDNEEPF